MQKESIFPLARPPVSLAHHPEPSSLVNHSWGGRADKLRGRWGEYSLVHHYLTDPKDLGTSKCTKPAIS